MSLQEKLRIQAEPLSPASKANMLSSAAEIENETLREQIAHLQKRFTEQREILDEVRVMADREEAVMNEKLKRYKEKEESLRKQVLEKENEVERVMKLEATAKARIEEIEEGFRESVVALENAQAEVEGLRTEIAVSRSLHLHDRTRRLTTVKNLEGHTSNHPIGEQDVPTQRKETNNSVSVDDLQRMVERLSIENTEVRISQNSI